MTNPDESRTDFAQRLDLLFKRFTHDDGSEYSYEDVQNGTGKAVTATYIWRLRTGKATNPGFWVIKALSDFFGVPADYFFQSESDAMEMIERQAGGGLLGQQIQEESIKNIALRASELDEAHRQAVLGMIEYLLQNKTE